MNNSINIDLVVESVKNIVDNNRCVSCDKTDGTFMRYPCGHTSCEECAIVAEDCLVCLTPLQQCASKTIVPDVPLTLRVRNAATLLNACQDVFHTNVYRRKRISDQLKVEKELFPKCIQAPLKYSNKRKSIKSLLKNKENHPSFFGETILSSIDKRMENSFNYVNQWLNSNEKNLSRKPFTNLNISNEQRLCRDTRILKNKPAKISNKARNIENVFSQKPKRKRTHLENIQQNVHSQSHILDKHSNTGKKAKSSKKVKKEIEKSHTEKITENGNDESGIVVDDEAPITIDDSQIFTIDKDKNAWLAVLAAEKHQQHDKLSAIGFDSGVTANSSVQKTSAHNNELKAKVPFYKKSYLLETCKYCCNNNNDIKPLNEITADKLNKVSITVESYSFTTIINVTKNLPVHSPYEKHSISVQTDIIESFPLSSDKKESETIDENNGKKDFLSQKDNIFNVESDGITCSQDLFKDEGELVKNGAKGEIEANLKLSPNMVNGTKCLIIDESDSDEDIEGGCSLEVTAEIHRSCEQSEYGILTEVGNQEEHDNRTRRGPRGLTPTSTDSSEKENFDPNRVKKTKLGKKNLCKKVNRRIN